MAKSWRSNAKELLEYLSDEDIFQLASTASKGQVDFSSKNEAISVIVASCDSANDLLRKKKLKREYLLRYIWANEKSSDSGSLPIKADKRQLMNHVLTLWNCHVEDSPWSSSTPNRSNDESADDDPTETQSDSATFDSALMTEFAQRFLEWIYNLLNNSNTDEFGPQHFYGNCLLRLRCGISTEDSVTIEVDGGLNVAERLKQFVLREGLLFQPNLLPPNGFQIMQESHGAILLKSNGSTYRRTNSDQLHVLGPYEQTFLVIQDPQSKNWKIQQTALMIKAEISLSNLAVGDG